MALSCHRCGASLAELSLPLLRLDECPGCGCQLHVCLMCRNYDPRVPTACTEDDALEVRNKKSANFCDYFDPSDSAYRPGDMQADQAARSALSDLFSEPGAATDKEAAQALTPDQAALERAKKLFGD
jgi:hypothetical protein